MLLALAIGSGIALLDAQPTWDDAGATADAILITAAGFSTVRLRCWWWGIVAVGGPIPILALGADRAHPNWGSLLAFTVAAVGMVRGLAARQALDR